MKRWMLDKIIGNGQSTEADPLDLNNTGPFRPQSSDVINASSKGVIVTINDPQDPDYGKPKYEFCFGRVAAADMQLVKLGNIYLFPDSSLDHLMSSIGTDPVNDTESALFALRQACEVRGLSTDFWLQHPTRPWGGFTYREVLLGIAQQHEPAVVDLDRQDVAEPVI